MNLNDNNAILCPCCFFQFDSLNWLIKHLREIKNVCFGADDALNSSKLFGCKFCLLSLQTANELADHLERCHIFNIQGEEDCVNKVQNHFNVENNVNNRFMNQCKYCPKSFKRNTDLQRHELIHTGERPFTCSKCFLSFRTKQTLETHQKTHSNSKEQYQCSFCQKYFLSRSSLKLHLRIHTGEAPFKCQNVQCSLMFRTKKLMLTHYKNFHCQQIIQEDGQIIEEPINITKSQQKSINSFDNQFIALNGLLELNTKIGQKKSRKCLNLSKNSAFSKFGETKRFEGRRRSEHSISFDTRNGQFGEQPEAFGEPPIRNIGSVPLYIDQNMLSFTDTNQQQNYCQAPLQQQQIQIIEHNQLQQQVPIDCNQQQQIQLENNQIQQIQQHQQQINQQPFCPNDSFNFENISNLNTNSIKIGRAHV